MDPQLEQARQMKRLSLVSALCVCALVLWGGVFDKKINNPVTESANINSVNVVNDSNKVQYSEEKLTSFDKITAIQSIQNSKDVVKFEYGEMHGLINRKFASIDFMEILDYNDDKNKDKPVNLLVPHNAHGYYYIDFGWLNQDYNNIFNKETLWHYKKDNNSIILDNNKNGHFYKIILLKNDKYLWDIRMESTDKSALPYSRIKREILPEDKGEGHSHEGITLVQNGKLNEIKYSDIKKEKQHYEKLNGWIGFDDKYWFVGFIEDSPLNAGYSRLNNCGECYQIDIIASNPSNQFQFKMYTGAKELDTINMLEKKYDIKLFDRVIDFGWLYFITMPLLHLLKMLYNITGSFGVAIIIMTIIIRIAMLPMANKSYKAMGKMKDIAPKISDLKVIHADDKRAFNLAVMELYKREKINPLAGFVPLLLQIPIFFALYKVFLVSIEMRGAPFLFWITDLSKPDPTSLFNLFGILPYSVPKFLQLGILPMFMGLTMFVQQKLGPQPTDQSQAKVMKLLPIIFTFMFSGFASGLVLYWSVNNIISILQQYFVTRKTK